MDVLVLGNGESRKHLCFKENKNPVIGCNAIHRDMLVDHLICCDRRMVEEAVNNPKIKNTKIYTRAEWSNYFLSKHRNILALPCLPYTGLSRQDQPVHWGSGPYAVLLAATLSFKRISLYGFDLYPNQKLINNIYKGTSNYLPNTAKAVDPSYWIYQIGKIFECFTSSYFKVYNTENWNIPNAWKKDNVELVRL